MSTQRSKGFTAAIAAGLAALTLSIAPAGAQGRIDVRQLTCDQARALVRQSGAVVFTTGRHTYDRYVAGERFCPIGHIAKRAWVTTRDAQSCSIGYRCVLDTRDDRRRWWLDP